MAVAQRDPYKTVKTFDDWYDSVQMDEREGVMRSFAISPCAARVHSLFERWRSEHQKRVADYFKYETQVDAEVVSAKPDLPNVSSGEIAGMARRTARNIVQHTPNVEVISEFDDDSPAGIFALHILRSKVIREELNSNYMQQNLFSSTMASFTLGFEAVMPVLVQEADKSWVMEYDAIHYQDVFPDPGVKDVQRSREVFVRRYLTKSELHGLIQTAPAGWNLVALRTLAKTSPPARQMESVSKQDRKHHTIPDGYEIVTWYSRSGAPFLTYDVRSKMLLRIEKNVDPLLRLPVHFLVLERDNQQPLGKSQVSLVFGRQEFQDLMLNGAMKLWYRNINPTLIGYGTGLNGVPNMSPGKYTNIPNPNAKIEAFEVSTQTLLQYGTISQQNMGSMVNLIGAADQQMAASAGNGMSATPQGVEAQEKMVDSTTNNFQKAVEKFFSDYCSYALTVYFAEMKGAPSITPTADARRQLIGAGLDETLFDDSGALSLRMSDLAKVYNVRCIPGSLVELEDEKQLRLLNQLFVPLSQAMPALAAANDPKMLANAAAAMQFIISKQIKLSGAAESDELAQLFLAGPTQELTDHEIRVSGLETAINDLVAAKDESQQSQQAQLSELQDQIAMLIEAQGTLMKALGVTTESNTSEEKQENLM